MPSTSRKLLSTDMDGTIVFDGRIGDADLAAMARWRAAGNILLMNTGRSITALASALDGFDLDYDAASLYTGAVVTDGEGKVLDAVTMPDGVTAGVLELVDGADGVTVFTTTLDQDFLVYDTIGSDTGLLTLFKIGTLDDLAGHTVVGVPVRVEDGPVFERIRDGVAERWGGRVIGFRNQDFYDLVPAGISKGTGLRAAVEALTAPGARWEGETIETWTIGDSWNDIEMHEAADHAICLPWSPPEVTAICERSTPSIAALIDELLEGDE